MHGLKSRRDRKLLFPDRVFKISIFVFKFPQNQVFFSSKFCTFRRKLSDKKIWQQFSDSSKFTPAPTPLVVYRAYREWLIKADRTCMLQVDQVAVADLKF